MITVREVFDFGLGLLSELNKAMLQVQKLEGENRQLVATQAELIEENEGLRQQLSRPGETKEPSDPSTHSGHY